jgi:outer membrane biosynthesis protein TonB
MKKKIFILLALLMVLTLVFVACKDEPTPPEDTTVADQPTEAPTQGEEDPTAAPTDPETPTEPDEPTEAPTQEPDEPTEKPTEKPTEPADEKGCGSAIGATVVVMTAVLGLGATVVLKKKED